MLNLTVNQTPAIEFSTECLEALKSPRPAARSRDSITSLLSASDNKLAWSDLSVQTHNLAKAVHDKVVAIEAKAEKVDLATIVRDHINGIKPTPKVENEYQKLFNDINYHKHVLRLSDDLARLDKKEASAHGSPEHFKKSISKIRSILSAIRKELLPASPSHSRRSSISSSKPPSLTRSRSSSSSESIDVLDLELKEHDVPRATDPFNLTRALAPLTGKGKHKKDAIEIAREQLVLTAGHHRPSDGVLLFV